MKDVFEQVNFEKKKKKKKKKKYPAGKVTYAISSQTS